jgi:hypothetical protein
LLHFLVRLGVLLGRIALRFGDVRLNLFGRFGLVAGRLTLVSLHPPFSTR